MRRSFRPSPFVVDAALAALLTVPTIAGLVLDEAQPDHAWWIVASLAASSTLPLAARRSHPVAVLGAVLAGTVALNVVGVNTLGPGIFVAMYTVGAHVERRRAIATAVPVLGVLAASLAVRDGGFSFFGELVPVAGAWLLGQYLGTRRAYLRELEQKAERLERERDESERRAIADEQARIARELHDVIAHNVSVMVVQASGGREVFAANPAAARDALVAIETTGREALTELRRLLGVARSPGDAREPQPGIARLAVLVEQVRAAGLDVRLDVDGEPRALAPGVDLSAYRLVQEALTNTLKHAGASRALVRVRHGRSRLEVEVVDDGAGPTVAAPDGRGLIGMRERVALFGGELEVGEREEGGFRVAARFPLGDAA